MYYDICTKIMAVLMIINQQKHGYLLHNDKTVVTFIRNAFLMVCHLLYAILSEVEQISKTQ